MRSVRPQFVLLLGLSLVSHDSRAQRPQAQPSQADAQQPALPLTPEQMPLGPIIVSYQNGQLTVEAQNSTLTKVLRAACDQTGTALDLPQTDERVVGSFGPGPPSEVFASLLNGSGFNYVMIGSPYDATRITQLTLLVKPTVAPPMRPVHSEPPVAAKAAEPTPASPSSQQAKQPPAEPRVADQSPTPLPRHRYRRR
jgi:hypothetical protein